MGPSPRPWPPVGPSPRLHPPVCLDLGPPPDPLHPPGSDPGHGPVHGLHVPMVCVHWILISGFLTFDLNFDFFFVLCLAFKLLLYLAVLVATLLIAPLLSAFGFGNKLLNKSSPFVPLVFPFKTPT